VNTITDNMHDVRIHFIRKGLVKMKVSVIICTYSMERYNDLLETVNSIMMQTYPNIEIIVSIDNNEKMLYRLKEIFRSGFKIITNNKKKGLSDTRNAGISVATGDIIAFIDDDAIADKEWVNNIVCSYEDENIVAVGGRLIPIWTKERPKWFPPELDWVVGCTYKGHPEIKTQVRNLIGCNMSFRREVIVNEEIYFSAEIGRIDKIPLGCEETLFCIKLKNANNRYEIIYSPDAIVFHKVVKYREKISYVLKRCFYEGISKAVMNKNNHSGNMLAKLEGNYLKFLIFKSMTNYFYNSLILRNPFSNTKKLLVLIVSIVFVISGYACKNATLAFCMTKHRL